MIKVKSRGIRLPQISWLGFFLLIPYYQGALATNNPNFVFIITDDISAEDWGMYGNKHMGFLEFSASQPAGSENWVQHLKERPKDKPFFFWFASHDAHRDWQVNDKGRVYDPEEVSIPPYLYDGPRTRKDLSGYYHEISRSDNYAGLVSEELVSQGILENTYFIYFSDNGRPFPRSKTYLYQNGSRTPLIFFGPNVKAGNTQSLVSSLDLAPTILNLAGIPIPESIQGVSFMEILKDHDAVVREVAFAERNWHRFSMHERMVKMGDWLYIRNNWPNNMNLGGDSDPHMHPAPQELWYDLLFEGTV